MNHSFEDKWRMLMRLFLSEVPGVVDPLESGSVGFSERPWSCLAIRVEPKTVPNPAKEYTIPLSILDVFPWSRLIVSTYKTKVGWVICIAACIKKMQIRTVSSFLFARQVLMSDRIWSFLSPGMTSSLR